MQRICLCETYIVKILGSLIQMASVPQYEMQRGRCTGLQWVKRRPGKRHHRHGIPHAYELSTKYEAIIIPDDTVTDKNLVNDHGLSRSRQPSCPESHFTHPAFDW